MKNSSTRFNWKHLWQAALVLPVSIGSLSLASQAATVSTATADFEPAVVDLTCEFSGGEGVSLLSLMTSKRSPLLKELEQPQQPLT